MFGRLNGATGLLNNSGELGIPSCKILYIILYIECVFEKYFFVKFEFVSIRFVQFFFSLEIKFCCCHLFYCFLLYCKSYVKC